MEEGGSMPGPPSPSSHPLLGRQEVLAQLHDDIARVRDEGAGRVTLVTGGRGTGKSRIASAAAEVAREAGFQRATAELVERAVPRAFDLFSNLSTELSQAGRSWEEAMASPARDAPIALTGVLARADPEERDLSLGPNLETVARAPLHLHEQVVEWRKAVDARVEDWFHRVTYRGSLLFIVENLHAADEESKQLLARLLPELLKERPLWLLITVENREGAGEALGRVLSSLEEAGHLDTVVLRNLTRAETERFVRLLEADQPRASTAEEVDQLYALSKGNPFLIEQLLPYLRRGEEEGDVPTAVPKGIGEIFGRLVAAVPARDRRVLAYAAVIGPEFDFRLLARATGEEEETLAEVVERLHSHGLLVERGPDRFAFLTRTVRAITYGGLSGIRRRILHQRVARAIEQGSSDRDPTTEVELAQHLAAGGEPQRAGEAFLRAAEKAAAGLDLTFAAECTRRCYELERSLKLGSPAERARRLDRLALLWRQAGDTKRERAAAEEAMRLLASYPVAPGVMARHSVTLARALIDSEERAPARTLLERALPVLESEGEPEGVAEAYRLLGNVCYATGQYSDALAFYHLAHDAIRETGQLSELGRATISIADAQMMLEPGNPEKARRWYDRGLQLLEKANDRLGLLFANVSLAAAASQGGLGGDAERARRAAVALAAETPPPARLLRSALRKAERHIERGEGEVAAALLTALEAVVPAGGEFQPWVRLRLAEALLTEGRVEPADPILHALEDDRRADPAVVAEARLLRGLLLFRSGDPSAASMLREERAVPRSIPGALGKEVAAAQDKLGVTPVLRPGPAPSAPSPVPLAPAEGPGEPLGKAR